MNSAPATSTDTGWLLGLLQASDALYPTGSYAHSFGLEGLIDAGVVRDRATLRTFLLNSVLPSLRNVDLPLAAHAWEALGSRNWTAVGEVCVLAAALRAPRELRAAAEAIGRQRVELLANVHEAGLAREFLRRAAEARWPHCTAIAAALEARVHGAPFAAVTAALCYAAVAGVIAAATKLLRLGQNAAQALLTETLALCPPMVGSACALPLSEIGWFNPWLDAASARHETARARLFIS